MKLKVRRTKTGMSISFRAGKSEGSDLAAAVMALGAKPQANAATGIIESLKDSGYRATKFEATDTIIDAEMSKPARDTAVARPAAKQEDCKE